MPTLDFRVDGIPVTQGSKRAFVVGKRAVVVDTNKAKLRPWRERVAEAAREAAARHEIFDGPLAVALTFWLPRPATVKRDYPHVNGSGDIDKLTRSILDSLTDADVWKDDSQVCQLVATKYYSLDTPPSVEICVASLQ